MRALIHDRRGVAYVEMLIAFPTVLVAFLGTYMFAYLASAHLISERAASAAVRAAAVYMADADSFHPGGDAQRSAYVLEAARRVLLASPGVVPGSLRMQVSGERSGFAVLRASLSVDFDCTMFAVGMLCGLDRKVTLRASAAMSYQGF
jgi:hypothetical protein